MVWNFTLYLKNFDEVSDELAETLYGSFSDGTLSSSCGHVKIGFGRDASSLQAAIQSAVSDVRRHGLAVDRIEIEEEELAEWQAQGV